MGAGVTFPLRRVWRHCCSPRGLGAPGWFRGPVLPGARHGRGLECVTPAPPGRAGYTSVSTRSRSILRTLPSTATWLVMHRAKSSGNQPVSPSRSRSP